MNKYQQAFSQSFPKAVDFAQSEYEKDKELAEIAATENSYFLAGIRLGRAVFSSKPR